MKMFIKICGYIFITAICYKVFNEISTTKDFMFYCLTALPAMWIWAWVVDKIENKGKE